MTTDDTGLDARIRAIRAEYADEEAEAAELEAAERAASLDVPLSLRISHALDDALRERAAAEQMSTSALIRKLLTRALTPTSTPSLTVEQVEEIARRVYRESA